jgi:hypothetical protein
MNGIRGRKKMNKKSTGYFLTAPQYGNPATPEMGAPPCSHLLFLYASICHPAREALIPVLPRRPY